MCIIYIYIYIYIYTYISLLEYVQSIQYLGAYIETAQQFKCTYDHVKLKWYRTFNAIYSKSKAAKSELVSFELYKDY